MVGGRLHVIRAGSSYPRAMALISPIIMNISGRVSEQNVPTQFLLTPLRRNELDEGTM
jgi:hypothetical protein